MSTAQAEQTAQKFEHWALVEIMGHQRLAGLVSEQTIAGTAFLRVDVPEVQSQYEDRTVPAFTTYLGSGSIYRLTPVSEEIARKMATSFEARPVKEYELRALPAPSDDPIDGEFDDD